MTVRIVTWNVRQGGGRRQAAIAAASAAFAADVIVLSEYQRDSKVPDLKSLLADHGYSEWADSAPNGRYLGVAIAANKPLDEAQALEVTPPWAGLAAARVDGLLVVGVYGPGSASHLGDNRPIKGQWWDALLEKVDAWKDDACVMVGDFNTGAHGRDEKGQTFVASDKFEALLTHGFRDAWREKHGVQAQQWSWWSNQGGGYRLGGWCE